MAEKRTYLSADQVRELRGLDPAHTLFDLAWTWGWILASWALYIARPGLLTLAIGWLIVSGRHLALAILMHEGAHGLLFKDKKWNDRVGQWLTGYPILSDMLLYRMIHLQHHKATWTKQDPDLGLAKPFPITKASMGRKVLRDLTGRTGYQRYRAIVRLSAGLSPNGKGLEGKPLGRCLKTFAQRQKGFLITNALMLAGLSAFGHPEAYLLLWVVPALTGYSLVLRLRSIAEHAAISDPEDELRQTRTTLAPAWVRFFIAPHHVGYHLEHHLYMWVPHYRLVRMHRMLGANGILKDAEVERGGYRAVWRKAASKLSEAAGPKERASVPPFSGG